MADRTCQRCRKEFSAPCYLKRHNERKKPCNLDDNKDSTCTFCAKSFTSMISMYRHIREVCVLAREDRAKKISFEEKFERLTELVESMALQPSIKNTNTSIVQTGTVNNGTVNGTINNGTVNTTVNTINYYDAGASYVIPYTMVSDIFAENPMLITYSRMHYTQQCDHEIAAPYIAKVLTEIVKRVCVDPAHHNVHLNPKRSDQVMVYVPCEKNPAGKWEVRPLPEVVRNMFDRVAHQVFEQTKPDYSKLDLNVQCSLPIVSTVYTEIPEKVVGAGKPAMEAHFANL